METDKTSVLDDETARDYAAGRQSWREIRKQTGVDDFQVMLESLGRLGLRLPRAAAERPSKAKDWMRDILSDVTHPA